MLTRLDLVHFKCFEYLKLPLGRLTLLSGTNASGKSSVLQALVLLHQTMKDHEWSKRLLLNGSELQLGTVTDVVDKVNGRRSFSIGVVNDGYLVEWSFEGESRTDMSVQIEDVVINDIQQPTSEALHFLFPVELSPKDEDLVRRLRQLCYLTAERVGPREVYPLEDFNFTNVVGPRGESTVSLLHWGKYESVIDDLRLQNAPPTRLHQVNMRMREFFPGCSIDVQQVSQTNSATLGLRTSDATDFHRPIHVGFGLTQILPIIVAALSAQPGDLLLIENPEVHLHPAGQALMGRFLSSVADAGIQVVLETHSDHVLNGVRRAVKAGEVKPEDVCIHFFRDRELEGAQVISPNIDQAGNLDAWPQGFFDQFDKDMNYFAGWGD